MITWVVFDAMGVIFTVGDDTRELLVPFVQDYNPSILQANIEKFYLQASRGKISSQRFWIEVGLGSLYPEIEKRYLDTKISLDKDFIAVVREMSGQYHLGLISNDVSEWSLYLRRKHGLHYFSALSVSGDEMCRKPDRQIYERFLQKAGVLPRECVFVDDRCANLATAASLGFKTIQFLRESPEHCQADAMIESFTELRDTVEFLVSP